MIAAFRYHKKLSELHEIRGIGEDSLRRDLYQTVGGLAEIAGIGKRTGIEHIYAVVIHVVRHMRMTEKRYFRADFACIANKSIYAVIHPMSVTMCQQNCINFSEFR